MKLYGAWFYVAAGPAWSRAFSIDCIFLTPEEAEAALCRFILDEGLEDFLKSAKGKIQGTFVRWARDGRDPLSMDEFKDQIQDRVSNLRLPSPPVDLALDPIAFVTACAAQANAFIDWSWITNDAKTRT